MRLDHLREFLKLESTSGIILLIAACIALILDNSRFAYFYETILHVPITFHFIHWRFEKPILFWINDGLMTLFFLVVGLELKRELLAGELASFSRAALPGVAALGGMLVPAVIYIAVNYYHPAALKGWAVPVATDIVFALGVLTLFGKRVPLGLKLFLMALAIFDDVGAIIIIALFYIRSLSYVALLLGVLALIVLWLLNRKGVERLFPYLLIGFLLWGIVLKSGVHATVAGVLLAFFIPVSGPLQRLESNLHPWVAYLVTPLFVFANSGLSFQGITLFHLLDDTTLGIILGLFLGKQLGVFSFAFSMIKLGWAKLPEQSSWLEMYGVALLCGIGFTMSLFLGTLAFEADNPVYLVEVRLGVLVGSLLSGVIGAMVLFTAFRSKKKKRMQA
ncbi:MAG: hypothetical protein ACD_45C00355G0004 [uncultured bacterium]|nr:MAG: hypothetical protein ACD_45C00355G0004 [uncultured bacterium]